MNLNCIQCHQSHQISNNLSSMEGNFANFICPDCLIEHVWDSPEFEKNQNGDKRHAMRLPVFVPVRVSPQNRGIIVTSALIIDASIGGVCIETKISLEINETIKLKLRGQNSNFQAIGKIVHLKSYTSEEIPLYKAGITLLEAFKTSDPFPA